MAAIKRVEYLIVHITASVWGDIEAITRWHTDNPPKGRGWDGPGYHFVILNCFPTYMSWIAKCPAMDSDGEIQKGRPEGEIGAHALGYNSKSLGIAMVGENGSFTSAQLNSCLELCSDLMDTYSIPVEKVIGHYETGNTSKPCPQLDMEFFRSLLRDWIK